MQNNIIPNKELLRNLFAKNKSEVKKEKSTQEIAGSRMRFVRFN